MCTFLWELQYQLELNCLGPEVDDSTNYPLKNSPWSPGIMWILRKKDIVYSMLEGKLQKDYFLWNIFLCYMVAHTEVNKLPFISCFEFLSFSPSFGLILSSSFCHWQSSWCPPVFKCSPFTTSILEYYLVPSTGHQFICLNRSFSSKIKK